MKLSELIEKYGDCEVADDLLGMIKPKGDWKPKKGEEYYLITTGLEICHDTYINSGYDNNRLSKRNVYRTKEEAQFALDMYNFCKERSFEPDWGDDNEIKCYLYLRYEDKKADYSKIFSFNYFFPFYYPTAEAVKEIINKYSFEELEKYYGRV